MWVSIPWDAWEPANDVSDFFVADFSKRLKDIKFSRPPAKRWGAGIYLQARDESDNDGHYYWYIDVSNPEAIEAWEKYAPLEHPAVWLEGIGIYLELVENDELVAENKAWTNIARNKEVQRRLRSKYGSSLVDL